MKKAVLAFYKFVHLQNPHGEKEKLLSFLQEISTVGTIILGKEGINGMCSLDIVKLEKVKSFLQLNFSLENSDFKTNLSHSDVFKKLSCLVVWGHLGHYFWIPRAFLRRLHDVAAPNIPWG